MIYPRDSGTEFYIAKVGRFNVEGYFDWQHLENLIDSSQLLRMPDFSHSQIQTLLGSIGATKKYGIWIPPKDRLKLDWSITNPFSPLELLPYKFEAAERVLQEIDVIWVNKASSEPIAFFEVEYSTPIYSGLLRLNDAYLIANNANSRFMVVSNDQRKELFVRQLNRPTFQTSRLSEICTFLDYKSVYIWHSNISKNSAEKSGENANEDS